MTLQNTTLKHYLRRHIALPAEHGAWVFILSPLLIGLVTGGKWKPAVIFLIVAALAAFLIRQPIMIAVKSYSGRRSSRDLPAAWLWMAVYAFMITGSIARLVLSGYTYILYLAIPGIPVFLWHLYLVSKRAERRQVGVEIVASGVLALTATAAYWVAVGDPQPTGWLLFILCWMQSAASIVYAYLRLEQRELSSLPNQAQKISMGSRTLLYTSFNLVGITLLAYFAILPRLLPLAFAIQWLEAIWGTFYPAIGWKPTRIGLRQLVISIFFTLLFILAWKFS